MTEERTVKLLNLTEISGEKQAFHFCSLQSSLLIQASKIENGKSDETLLMFKKRVPMSLEFVIVLDC